MILGFQFLKISVKVYVNICPRFSSGLPTLTSSSCIPRSCCRQDSILLKPLNDDVPYITDDITSLQGVANSRRIGGSTNVWVYIGLKAVETLTVYHVFRMVTRQAIRSKSQALREVSTQNQPLQYYNDH